MTAARLAGARPASRLVPAWVPAAALAFGVAVAAGVPSGPALLALALAPLAAVVVVTAGLPVLLGALVLCSQLSGWRFEVAGLHFLPEHVALLAFAAALALRAPATVLRRPVAYEVLLLLWVLWNAVASAAFSADVGDSLAIVGWLALAWAILWCVRGYVEAHRAEARRMLELGLRAAGVAGFAGGALWLAALAGLTSFGVQPEYLTGTVAARGLSIEANLFGSLELFWLVLALRWRSVNDVRVPAPALLGLGVGIVASMTRAVWLAALLVVVVARAAGRQRRRRVSARVPAAGASRASLRVLAALVALVVLLPLSAPAGRKFLAAFDFGSGTGRERVRNWDLALDDLDSPGAWLLGRGTNSYGQRHASRTLAGQPDYLGNLGLTVVYDTGVTGAALFGAALVAFALHRHAGWGRLFKVLFVVALMIVGAAASPIWFGYVWITVVALDTVWRAEDLEPCSSAGQSEGGVPCQVTSGLQGTGGRRWA